MNLCSFVSQIELTTSFTHELLPAFLQAFHTWQLCSCSKIFLSLGDGENNVEHFRHLYLWARELLLLKRHTFSRGENVLRRFFSRITLNLCLIVPYRCRLWVKACLRRTQSRTEDQFLSVHLYSFLTMRNMQKAIAVNEWPLKLYQTW